MTTIGAYEAKTKLADLLDRVEKGDRITITRHGVPVAVLGPVADTTRIPVAKAIAAIRNERKGRSLGGKSVSAMIKEGRR